MNFVPFLQSTLAIDISIVFGDRLSLANPWLTWMLYVNQAGPDSQRPACLHHLSSAGIMKYAPPPWPAVNYHFTHPGPTGGNLKVWWDELGQVFRRSSKLLARMRPTNVTEPRSPARVSEDGCCELLAFVPGFAVDYNFPFLSSPLLLSPYALLPQTSLLPFLLNIFCCKTETITEVGTKEVCEVIRVNIRETPFRWSHHWPPLVNHPVLTHSLVLLRSVVTRGWQFTRRHHFLLSIRNVSACL